MNKRPPRSATLTKELIIRYLRFLAHIADEIASDKYTDDKQLTYLRKELDVFKQRAAAARGLRLALKAKIKALAIRGKPSEIEGSGVLKLFSPFLTGTTNEKLPAAARLSALKDFQDQVDTLLFKINTF